MKKILFLYSAADYGGMVKNINFLIKNISRKNFSLLLFAVDSEKETVAVDFNMPVEYLSVKGKIDYSKIKSLRKILIENQIEIISCHGYKANFYGLISSIGLKVKKVSIVHGWVGKSFKIRFYQLIDKILIRFFDRIVLLAEYQIRELRLLFVPNSKLEVIKNAIDIKEVRAEIENVDIPNIQAKDIIIGTCSRLEKEKDIGTILYSLQYLNEHIKLVVLGEGSQMDNMLELAKKLKVENRVIFMGFKSNALSYVAKFDLFVTSSISEGLPNSVLEAQTLEIPVIASDIKAHQELIEDGVNGILFKLKDSQDLSEKIKKIVNDSQLKSLIKSNAISKLKQSYSMKDRISKMEDLYSNVIC